MRDEMIIIGVVGACLVSAPAAAAASIRASATQNPSLVKNLKVK